MASTLIKIIKGTYGYWDGSKVVPKTAKDDPFPVEVGRAKELVDSGIAELAEADEADDQEDDEAELQEDAETEEQEDQEDEAVNLEELTLDELKKFAEPYGVKFKVGMKKTDLIEAIRSAKAEADEADDQEDDGEDAPTFNAEDAVQ